MRVALLCLGLLAAMRLSAADRAEQPPELHSLGYTKALEVVAQISSVTVGDALVGFYTTYENAASENCYTLHFSRVADPLAVVLLVYSGTIETRDMSSGIWHDGIVSVPMSPGQRFATYLPLSRIQLGVSSKVTQEVSIDASPSCLVYPGTVFKQPDAPFATFPAVRGRISLSPRIFKLESSDLPAPFSQRLIPAARHAREIRFIPLNAKQVGSVSVYALLYCWKGHPAGLLISFVSLEPGKVVHLVTVGDPELLVETSGGGVLHLAHRALGVGRSSPRIHELIEWAPTELYIPFANYDWQSGRESGLERLVGVGFRNIVTEWLYRQPDEVSKPHEVGELKFGNVPFTIEELGAGSNNLPVGFTTMPFSRFYLPDGL